MSSQAHESPVEAVTDVPGLLIGNEFTRVLIEVIERDGEQAVRLTSVRTGWVRTLPVSVVERISRLPLGLYIDALGTPFGPEPDLAFSPLNDERAD